jgi:hypothetical protein
MVYNWSLPHKTKDGVITLNEFAEVSKICNLPNDKFENSEILTSKKEFLREHKLKEGVLLISTTS